MRITLDWLKRHLDTEATLEEIVDALNRIGLEVEDVEDRSAELAPFTVGYVVKAEQHPNADKLRVCMVETGSGEVQVVCGAPNARTGMKGVFAPSGSHIPGTGVDLKETEIRGVASRGMLCSEREMGLSDEHDGIIDLPEDAEVGASYAALSGLDDPVIDIGVTPDRGDCFSVRGIARDLAAAGLGTLKLLDTSPVPGSFKSPLGIELRFDDATKDACPAFIGRYFKGLKNGPSPSWMQQKLRAVGLRPISVLVDITNWLTMDLGRPAHIYDADKVKGTIGVRIAEPGERFDALNDKSYDTDGEMTVIFDDSGMLGLGGVIGGESTGADDGTVNGFLEIALFDPIRTAATGRKLGLVTDARQRFERGIDNTFAPEGMEIATRLVLELCGGEASEVVQAGEIPTGHETMNVRPSRVQSLGGIAIVKRRAEAILADLGFEASDVGDDQWSVSIPTWRHDMQCEADVIEEVLRIHGFDEVPMVSLPRVSALTRPVLSTRQKRVRWARRTLASRGMSEAVTYSFVSSAQAGLFGGGNQGLTLVNPISADMDMMRPSSLPGLLAAVSRNQARGMDNFALFEIGPVYGGIEPEGQKTMVGALRAGRSGARHWNQADRPVDAFDAKADALAVLAAIGAPVDNLQTSADAPDWYHPGRSGVLRLGPKAMATFGELHPKVVAELDAAGPVAAIEINLEDVPEPKAKSVARTKLAVSPYQPVHRDFAFVLDADVSAEKLVRAVKGADKALIDDVAVFDLYEGANLGENRKSLAVAVTLQPTDRTMTDDDLEAVSEKIVAAVAKQTGGELRG
ncbi:MAG: phenylalanine--tRNA ligase subunit beta [Rhodospirillaceae bacterium]|nr:phenylalanine--tRNA ligase subunit beta [Rhodospirillaceae bacterium]|tara:strand:+ start:28250 stop:30652 length:2403 start_codon:yes stop_codon:yes gene_type:complete